MTLSAKPLLAASFSPVAPRKNPVMRYLSRFDDGELVRWVFRGLLLGAVGVLALDLRDLAEHNGWVQTPAAEAAAPASTEMPVLPPAVEVDSPLPSADPRKRVTADEGLLRRPMVFRLDKGGVLRAEGTIEPGTAARLREELDARGEYVRTMTINSPGGALDDAMMMAKAVRERGIATEVADGALCASSCPLLFAGGVTRLAGKDSAVGVHQFYAASRDPMRPEQAMADAQITTARISRHLAEMGVDPALWLHALDTPPQSLYYFSADEMSRFKLVTSAAKLARK